MKKYVTPTTKVVKLKVSTNFMDENLDEASDALIPTDEPMF